MKLYGTLFIGVLVVVAMMAITSSIMALAPIVAGAIVIYGLVKLTLGKPSDTDEPY